MIHVVAVDVASGDVIESRETSPGASADRGAPSAEQHLRIVKATEFIGSDVKNAEGDDLGDISDLALDGSTGEIRYAVLSFGGWLGIGDKLFAVPYEAFQHTNDELQLNVPKEKLKTATGFDKENWPNMADPRWAEEVNRFYGIGRATRPDTAGTEVRIVRASTMVGADVHNRNDEDLGEIEDLVLDPQDGKVRYAVLAHGGVAGLGEKLFAIPWNALSGSDDKIIVDITEEKLENAPGFDDEHWPDMANRSWGEDVHRYYGQRPYWDEE
jgi:sporulation protein YlmC with PRC-barrel domain